MTKSTTRFHIQASIDGGTWRDTDPKGFHSQKRAERKFDQILRGCYPQWRGLRIIWRIVKRHTTVTTDTEIAVFATPSHGKTRSLLSELFVPQWLPAREQNKLRMLRIPGAPDQYQPNAIQNQP